MAPTGDLEGATNRAYYASFHAARAALAHFGELPETVKSHSTVIGLFGKHIVQTGRMDTENGRLLNRAHQLRNLTDYNVGTIDHDRIEVAVIGPEAFVSGIQLILRKKR
ncbi:HEPN domain-containing protein [Skermanella aerolata]|uniref:HEPN domain-containing protein n=1 Tax=Skermanella aerolata TaxID=393310 RepID=UPI003D215F6B